MVERKRIKNDKAIKITVAEEQIVTDEEKEKIAIEEKAFNEEVTTVNAELIERKPIRWKKVGGGSFSLNNRFIKPGQIFLAFPEEIPVQFRDLVIPLEEKSLPVNIEEIKKKSSYKLEEKSDGWDILDSFGKVLNEKPMEKEVAERILVMLQ
jgi:hypothetical protein